MPGTFIANLDDDYLQMKNLILQTSPSVNTRTTLSVGPDMSLSIGDDSDANNQLGVNHMNIRDLFFTDLEADYLSDTDFNPTAQSAADKLSLKTRIVLRAQMAKAMKNRVQLSNQTPAI